MKMYRMKDGGRGEKLDPDKAPFTDLYEEAGSKAVIAGDWVQLSEDGATINVPPEAVIFVHPTLGVWAMPLAKFKRFSPHVELQTWLTPEPVAEPKNLEEA